MRYRIKELNCESEKKSAAELAAIELREAQVVKHLEPA
jgi:hypothetical protein